MSAALATIQQALDHLISKQNPRPPWHEIAAAYTALERGEEWALQARDALAKLDHRDDECGGECAVTRNEALEQLGVVDLLAAFDRIGEGQ